MTKTFTQPLIKLLKTLVVSKLRVFGVFAGVGLVALGYWSLHSWQGSSQSPASSASRKFRDAPAFELKDSKGNVHRLSDFKGSFVILHFWASWCPPCLPEIPQWLELAASFQGRPVHWVAISLDSAWSDVLKVLGDEKLPSQAVSLLDETVKVPDAYGTYQFPETYLISPDQKILHKWVGPQEWNRSELNDRLRQILRQGA